MLSCFVALLLLGVTSSRGPRFRHRNRVKYIADSVQKHQLEAEDYQSKDLTKFKDYDKYITSPTPAFPPKPADIKIDDDPSPRNGKMPIRTETEPDAELPDAIIDPKNLTDCATREELGHYSSPEFQLALKVRIEKLTERYSRLRSHKPLVKHQLRNKLSFLRTVLGNIGQDPTDLAFEDGTLDTTQPISLRFIKALNNVAGETSTVLGYLLAFGYLPKVMHLPESSIEGLESSDQMASPCQLEEAIGEFQKFNGLPVTRKLDAATVRKLKKARCGIPDVSAGRKGNGNRSRRNHRTKRYVTRQRRWKTGPGRPKLTYHVKNCTSTLPYHVCKEEIKLGIQRWTEVAQIYFKEVGEAGAETADFTLYFVSGEHPKKNISSLKNDEPFDGPGGVVGHAYFPRGGHIHFDNDETYTANSNYGINLRFITMHEMGHALGLEHTNITGSAMSPVYDPTDGMKGWEGADTLKEDDIAGIREKYGRGRGRVIALAD